MFKKKLLLIGKNSFISTNIYTRLKKKIFIKKISFEEFKKYKKNKINKFNYICNCSITKNYIQKTNPNDNLSYTSSLHTSIDIYGYNLNKIDDKLSLNVTNYQSNQNNEDNETLPTILPYINFYTGEKNINNFNYSNSFEFYNIFRDSPTDIHAKRQKKLSSFIDINKEATAYPAKIKFQSNIYNLLIL